MWDELWQVCGGDSTVGNSTFDKDTKIMRPDKESNLNSKGEESLSQVWIWKNVKVIHDTSTKTTKYY